MRIKLMLALGVLTASAAPAQEITAPVDRAPVPQVQEVVPEHSEGAFVVQKIQEERLQAEKASVAPAVQPTMQWWWLVGAIVVGVVIASIIL